MIDEEESVFSVELDGVRVSASFETAKVMLIFSIPSGCLKSITFGVELLVVLVTDFIEEPELVLLRSSDETVDE